MKKIIYVFVSLLLINLAFAEENYTAVNFIAEYTNGTRMSGDIDINISMIDITGSVLVNENQTVTASSDGRGYALFGRYSPVTWSDVETAYNLSIKINNDLLTGAYITKPLICYVSDHARHAYYKDITGVPDQLSNFTNNIELINITGLNDLNSSLQSQFHTADSNLNGTLETFARNEASTLNDSVQSQFGTADQNQNASLRVFIYSEDSSLNDTRETRLIASNNSITAWVQAQNYYDQSGLSGENVTSGTVSESYIDASICRDTEFQTGDSNLNTSLQSEITAANASTDECSEITGCVVGAYNNPDNVTDNQIYGLNGTTNFAGEVTGTYGAMVLDHDALDDQYYDSEGDLTALLDDNYLSPSVYHDGLGDYWNTTRTPLINTSFDLSNISNTGNIATGDYNVTGLRCIVFQNGFQFCGIG